MARRPETIETTLLAIELLRRIPRGRKITAKALHEQLLNAGIERELRTIQRQLEMLSHHFAIECDTRNRPYGYCWSENAKGVSLPVLTPQESLLLAMAEAHLKPILPARLVKSMTGFFTQAQRNLQGSGQSRLEAEWPDKVRIVATSQPLLPPPIAEGVFESVSEALYLNRWLKITYRNAGGKESENSVMPLGLAQQGPRLYLVCRFDGYNNERSLAMNRILAAHVSTFTFERPAEFSLKKYDDDGRFGFGEGHQIFLTFEIERSAGLHLIESPLSLDQTHRELSDDRLEFSATVVDSAMLNWFLAAFGEAVSNVERRPILEIAE
ncbi:helix-turn-helix transcriptional regulator [Pantoea piersonii]|uniref:helix-turn-helix transcriptional regulator n=1 Tax=Pantoea piersonii TaxID=2364647 RepID=UPI000EA25E77|nr:WYL domain-containing protein [Pantoea piersonii]MBZ6385947.1 WYL domain-containing protein [Pantoea piersonii]MBZ6399456.1 WYL domain-containing protein [Pantoea piersonii]MBZ6408021.1 WYL domain-containing protein [Pantoea piersonii]MBZ6427056.1 WYL domain-containing protein [Pantoea piersonii]NYB04462.1 WYL domain-containing protein [Pantoea piersonii]